MVRLRFDREKAWTAFQEYAAKQREYTDLKAKPLTPYRRKQLAIKLALADDARHAAYVLVDECVEIGVRQVFSRHPDQSMLDDLRQAARLRLYQFLPKMMAFCLNSEHYFRLSLSAVRRASLNEYSRLKRQTKREVSGIDDFGDGMNQWWYREEDHDEDDDTNNLPVAVIDQGFPQFEDRLLVKQSARNTYEKIKQRLMALYEDEWETRAAIALLRAIFLGSDLSDSLMRDMKVVNPREMRETVRAVVRAVQEDE